MSRANHQICITVQKILIAKNINMQNAFKYVLYKSICNTLHIITYSRGISIVKEIHLNIMLSNQIRPRNEN